MKGIFHGMQRVCLLHHIVLSTAGLLDIMIQVRLRIEVPRTLSSTQSGLELMTSRSWQYISCHWDACSKHCSNHYAISDFQPVITRGAYQKRKCLSKNESLLTPWPWIQATVSPTCFQQIVMSVNTKLCWLTIFMLWPIWTNQKCTNHTNKSSP